jgi:phosphohistidine phosphatase SixA
MAPASAQAHEITQVCLVAHVPGVANLVSLLTTKHVDLAVNYGPATLAEVILDIDEWSQIGPGTGFLHLLLAQ